MKLWKISQNFNTDYDTYDSAIVAAETEEEARNTEIESMAEFNFYRVWAAPEHVKVEYIGEAKEGTESGIILASFNAG